MKLNLIGVNQKTDKSSLLHNYLNFYEFFLSQFKDDGITLIELGVGPENNKGKSLLTWQEYFKNAVIVGVDVRADCKELQNKNILIEIGDCSSIDFLGSLGKKYSPSIILDDASHKWSHQILGFEILFPILKNGGIYICEDLGTSYPPASEKISWSDFHEDAATYFIKLVNLVMGAGRMSHATKDSTYTVMQQKLSLSIDYIACMNGAIVIKKK